MKVTASNTSPDGSTTYQHTLIIAQGSETVDGSGYQRQVKTVVHGGHLDGRSFKTFGKVYKTLRGAENDTQYWLSQQVWQNVEVTA